MRDTSTTIERAFELARSGSCLSISDVVRRLKEEGFEGVDAHTQGAGTRLQLRQLCRSAKAKPAD